MSTKTKKITKTIKSTTFTKKYHISQFCKLAKAKIKVYIVNGRPVSSICTHRKGKKCKRNRNFGFKQECILIS